MAKVLLLTNSTGASAQVLPALGLLQHTIKILPIDASVLIDAPVMDCVFIDARTDLAAGRHTKDSLLEMVNWLLEAADPVAAASLSPSLRP